MRSQTAQPHLGLAPGPGPTLLYTVMDVLPIPTLESSRHTYVTDATVHPQYSRDPQALSATGFTTLPNAELLRRVKGVVEPSYRHSCGPEPVPSSAAKYRYEPTTVRYDGEEPTVLPALFPVPGTVFRSYTRAALEPSQTKSSAPHLSPDGPENDCMYSFVPHVVKYAGELDAGPGWISAARVTVVLPDVT